MDWEYSEACEWIDVLIKYNPVNVILKLKLCSFNKFKNNCFNLPIIKIIWISNINSNIN